ncbi:hypothetical protein M1M25_gp099 [Tenacibaculum phage Gundel_1]|uniref:Uncharacterized protein n=1 Tax=Tenacibaculum phage Gundel_1 TaxID=2745672 RepID=A0A8E5EC28_9CAUD|nr:hypothetical protein M1M25_gp099 [Tenacibaculum phage Gundel_1]QQV91422.1 hypothetical protein Gundel1_100 [Tenacibaculum phage Gundel_1]
MKNLFRVLSAVLLMGFLMSAEGCEGQRSSKNNNSAKQEQVRTEKNQQQLNRKQPAPNVSWSLERDNLINRFKLMNDRTVSMYMYVFIEGVGTPIGYYIVNKVSSVNSQLTNPNQLVRGDLGSHYGDFVLDSPAEDGSYGTNGDAIFGFTPDGLYMEHNMKYIVATAPLKFKNVPMIGEISIDISKNLKRQLGK